MNEKYSEIELPVKTFLRIVRKDNEFRERAKLIIRDEKDREFVLCYEDEEGELQDLIVCDLI